jgi:hypothetical protein
MIIAFAAGRNAVEIPIELLGAFHHRSVCLPDGSKYWRMNLLRARYDQ